MMRLTIDHFNEVADFTGTARNYYIDCHVIFSEEEQAIVRERGLNHFAIKTNSELPMPTFAQGVVADLLRTLGPVIMLAAFGLLVTTQYTAPAWLFVFVGALSWLYGLYRTRQILKYEMERFVTLAHLLDDPKLRIWAKDPPWSKALADKLRADLVEIKAKIMASVELGKRESVDL